MAEKSPSLSDVVLVARSAEVHRSDLCVVGAQELENLKPRRHEGSRSREWRRLLLHVFGRTHMLLCLTKLGGMQLAVLAKRPLLPYLSPLHVCEVPCGVGNLLHNKGGQAVLFRVATHTSFLFINAHLAAHAHRVEDRNGDVDRVMTEVQSLLAFSLPGREGRRARASKESIPLSSSFPERQPHQPPPSALVKKVDRLFFLGDLNYRLELPREDIEVPLRRVKNAKVSLEEAVARLLEYDQLSIERLEKRRVFEGMVESPVHFLPTFKFNKGRDRYDTSPKKRAPAWTDRILFKACEGRVRCEKYDSVGGARHSDHRPVVGVFVVPLEGGEGAVGSAGGREGKETKAQNSPPGHGEKVIPNEGGEEREEEGEEGEEDLVEELVEEEEEEEEEEEKVGEEEEGEDESDDDSGYESEDEEEDDTDSDF